MIKQGLKNQVLTLRRDLESRLNAEEKLQKINEELRIKLEEYQKQNEENYRIAEENRLQLEDELDELSIQESYHLLIQFIKSRSNKITKRKRRLYTEIKSCFR